MWSKSNRYQCYGSLDLRRYRHRCCYSTSSVTLDWHDRCRRGFRLAVSHYRVSRMLLENHNQQGQWIDVRYSFDPDYSQIQSCPWTKVEDSFEQAAEPEAGSNAELQAEAQANYFEMAAEALDLRTASVLQTHNRLTQSIRFRWVVWFWSISKERRTNLRRHLGCCSKFGSGPFQIGRLRMAQHHHLAGCIPSLRRCPPPHHLG